MKCIWEQFDNSETEVNSEVYGRLAVTYKLWELCNNLKLTVDLTNEVLKDADVPPVIGAGINNWDQIDYDGTHYFHFDEVLELRDKETTLTQPGPLSLSSNWFANKKSVKNLIENDVCEHEYISLTVCNYDPRGNVVGQFNSNVLRVVR